jgi:hypothetical protein
MKEMVMKSRIYRAQEMLKRKALMAALYIAKYSNQCNYHGQHSKHICKLLERDLEATHEMTWGL